MTEWRSCAFVAVRVVLGCLLLAAASFKVYGASVSTVPPVGWFSASGVQAVAIGWEIFLGTWLLSGVAPFGSWLAAFATFTLLAGISGYLGSIGQATCGCFGTIEASPWDAFGVDIAALVLLIVGYPKLRPATTGQRGALQRFALPVACFALGIGVIFAFLTSMGAWVYGSPQAALARLRRQSLTVDRGYVDCGIGKAGEKLEGAVAVSNWTDHPVLLFGGTSDCSCVATIGLPLTIPPGESRSVPMRLRVPASAPGAFTREVELFADCEQQRKIRLRIGCRVE